MKKHVLTSCAIVLTLSACGGSGDSTDTSSPATRTKNAALVSTTSTIARRATPTTVNRPATTTTKTPAPTAAPTTLVTVPATGPKACSAQGPCQIGQTGPAGGIVFYAAASPQSWGQYMEVRPEAFEVIQPDICNLDEYNTYATGKIGHGLVQTRAVITACAKDGKPENGRSYARVNAYQQNGYSNWFIPAKDELQALIDSNVIKFPIDKDLTSGTWVQKPRYTEGRGFEILYGLKKESLAGTSPNSRAKFVEVMSDGTQTYGNPNNRWGWIYIARAFGPTA